MATLQQSKELYSYPVYGWIRQAEMELQIYSDIPETLQRIVILYYKQSDSIDLIWEGHETIGKDDKGIRKKYIPQNQIDPKSIIPSYGKLIVKPNEGSYFGRYEWLLRIKNAPRIESSNNPQMKQCYICIGLCNEATHYLRQQTIMHFIKIGFFSCDIIGCKDVYLTWTTIQECHIKNKSLSCHKAIEEKNLININDIIKMILNLESKTIKFFKITGKSGENEICTIRNVDHTQNYRVMIGLQSVGSFVEII